ncbi:MAG: hypothetical protein NTW74_23380, partial [Acidobacteria bacterium]|nr:hypothetical protein [Acidobacteriota bacterium]
MTGTALWQKQILAIVGLEWKKTLFAKRGLWVYALAFLPALLFGINAVRMYNIRASQQQIQMASPNATAIAGSIQLGMKADDAAKLLSEAKVGYSRFTRGRKREFIRYDDGAKSWELRFTDGLLTNKSPRNQADLNQNILAFAGVFQYFFLRLAIFFGCVGIFMILFRGELLDQSLHY